MDTAQELLKKLEGYGFTCEAGPLAQCLDWKALRAALSGGGEAAQSAIVALAHNTDPTIQALAKGAGWIGVSDPLRYLERYIARTEKLAGRKVMVDGMGGVENVPDGESAAQDYARKNPLGGPATMFRAIAERIELGEDYHAVLRDYSVTVGGPGESAQPLDRGEAVNLASNIVDTVEGTPAVTPKGVRSLADAVLRMDEELRKLSSSAARSHEAVNDVLKDQNFAMNKTMTKIELAYCEWTGGHLSTDDFHKEIAEAVSDEWVVSSSAALRSDAEPEAQFCPHGLDTRLECYACISNKESR